MPDIFLRPVIGTDIILRDTTIPDESVQSAIIGLATETGTAFALPAVSIRAIGLATETDTPFALPPFAARAIGVANESGSAFVLGRAALRSVGLAIETDTALALPRLQILPVGMALEIDGAWALPAVAVRAYGLSEEIDTAFALAAVVPSDVDIDASDINIAAPRFAITIGGPVRLEVARTRHAVEIGPQSHTLQVAANSNDINISLAG
jgi:hypothetical protein